MSKVDGVATHAWRWRGTMPPQAPRTWVSNENGIVLGVSLDDATERLKKAKPGITIHMINHLGELVI